MNKDLKDLTKIEEYEELIGQSIFRTIKSKFYDSKEIIGIEELKIREVKITSNGTYLNFRNCNGNILEETEINKLYLKKGYYLTKEDAFQAWKDWEEHKSNS